MHFFRLFSKNSKPVIEPVELECENPSYINHIELARDHWERLQRSGYPCDALVLTIRDHCTVYTADDFRKT
jgi:hypothetical protein